MVRIRTAFVSNSSSSSFIIVGKEIDLDDLFLYDCERDVYVLGTELYEGQDVFALNVEMIQELRGASQEELQRFRQWRLIVDMYEREDIDYDGEIIKINVGAVPEGGWMIVATAQRDMYPTSTVEKFIERYLEEPQTGRYR